MPFKILSVPLWSQTGDSALPTTKHFQWLADYRMRLHTVNSSIKPESPLPFRYHTDIVLQERIGKLWWVLRVSSVFTFLDVKTDLHFPFANCAASSQGPTAPNGIPYVRDWRRTTNRGSVWLSREEHLQFILPLFSFPKGLALLFFAKEFFLSSQGMEVWA